MGEETVRLYLPIFSWDMKRMYSSYVLNRRHNEDEMARIVGEDSVAVFELCEGSINVLRYCRRNVH